MRYSTKCPACGGTIAGFDLVPGNAGISGWSKNDAGELEPEWDGQTDMCWDGQMPSVAETPYGCTDCGALFAAKDLTFEEAV